MTIECLPTSTLPVELRAAGYDLIPAGEGERILGGAITQSAGNPALPVSGTQGTGTNEWYTPADIIEKARAVVGEIDLDPASSEIAQVPSADRCFPLEKTRIASSWPSTLPLACNGGAWLAGMRAPKSKPGRVKPVAADYVDGHVMALDRGRRSCVLPKFPVGSLDRVGAGNGPKAQVNLRAGHQTPWLLATIALPILGWMAQRGVSTVDLIVSKVDGVKDQVTETSNNVKVIQLTQDTQKAILADHEARVRVLARAKPQD